MSLTEYQKARDDVKAARERAKAVAKDALGELSKKVFTDNPTLVSFSWTQYTPYFNDGDECVFSVNRDPNIQMDGEEEREDYWDDEKDATPKGKAARDINSLLETFDDDDLREMFGDHMEIVVTRDGVEAEEYSHD